MGLLSGARVAVVDIETTGMSPAGGHAVLEVARVLLEDGEITDCWSTLVDPGRAIHADAIAVHGITPAMVAQAPAADVVAAELLRACEGATLAFHHAAFDLPFVAALLARATLPPLYGPVIDTLGLARGLLEVESHALPALAAQFGLPHEPAHRALGDALTTARLLRVLADRWAAERGIASLAELAAASQDALRMPRKKPAAPPAGASDSPEQGVLLAAPAGTPVT